MLEDRELKELLKKNIEISEKSLKILQKMHRAKVIGRFFWILKWMVIIGITLGLYYYMEPYLRELMDKIDSLMHTLNSIGDTGDNIDPEILEKLKNLMPR